MKRLAFPLSLRLGFVASRFALPSRASAGTIASFPLRVSADQRSLVDQNEKPFLVIGDSPGWLIVEPTPAQVDQHHDDRAAKGFNLLLANLIEHKFSTQPVWSGNSLVQD